MTDQGRAVNLFTAAKQLADSEIQLIQAIENSKKVQQSDTPNTMSANKRHGKKSAKLPNVRPSPALVAAKRDALQRQQLQGKKFNTAFVRDIYQNVLNAYNVKRKATGLVFDRFMAEHKCLWDPNYPECPERLNRVLERCKELGLVERCKYINPRVSTESEILMKHTLKQIDILKATDNCTNTETLETLSSKYDAIFIHPSTYQLSLLAVGSTINLVESICKGEVQNGMAIIRPPGHHAMKSEYCGYCFFNNIAIAAEKALSNKWASRILIVDWDVHHGQATQQMFYDDPRVVYFSIHRYENGEFWPNLKESDYHYIGEGLGEGFNFNVPLNKTGMTNADYIAIFQQVLLPMAYEFQPDLVLVSAGYDAAVGCPEGEMEVTPACYAHLLSALLSLAAGKVAVVLEGGYCLKSLAESAALTLRTLLGDPCPLLQPLELPSFSIRDTILSTIYSHRSYWKCYQYQDVYSINSVSNKDQYANHYLPVVVYKGQEFKPKVYETRNCYPMQSEEYLHKIDERLNMLIQCTNLNKAPNKVCLIYDEQMLQHCDTTDQTHPEKPNRICSIYKNHGEHGLLDRCYLLKGRAATLEELLLVHTSDYIDQIKKTVDMGLEQVERQASEFNSVYLHPETWSSACMSAGSLLQVVDSVLNGESQSGVAIVRPPGHHAEYDTACGFCIFNNIAIAARYAMQFHHTKRVLIVDWDVHHGNGTQSIFEDDPRVLYMSVHRYDNGSFFPNRKEANYTMVGSGAGQGFTVNVPWNKKGMGDGEYIAAFQQVILPIAYQFNPDLVLISAGFDACIGDPLGGCIVSPEMYGHLTHWLLPLANGRVILSLEGGYNINSISHAMTMCTKTLLADPLPMLNPSLLPCSSAVHSINNVLKVHKQYWPNLIFNMALPKEKVLPKVKNLNIKTDERTEIGAQINEQLESKIALEEIESEKLNLNISFDKKCFSLVTDKEISKLQNEIENIKIKNSVTMEPMSTDENIETMPSNTLQSDNHTVSDYTRNNVNQHKSSQERQAAFGGNSKNQGNPSGNNDEQQEGAAGHTTSAVNLMEYLSDNLQALIAGDMFAVVPLRECPHLSSVGEVPPSGINVHLPCLECQHNVENWICLQCYTVHCARSINQHGLRHAEETEHPMTLSFSDLSVWCYGCEAYIDNPRLYAARNAAHLSKFNEALPWTFDEPQTTSHQ